MRIVAVGECTLDRYVVAGVVRPGGISLNFAVHARRAGAVDVALVSAVGDGDGGVGAAHVRATLKSFGVDASHVRTLHGAMATQSIELHAGGERVFPSGGYEPGVLADFRLDATDLAFIATCDVVAAPVFREIAHLADALPPRRDGQFHVADLLDGADLGTDRAGIVPLLERFDALFMSGGASDVELLAAHAAGARAIVVVTHGSAGSTAIVGGRRVYAPAVPVPAAECIDATGCGDAFQAAFTVSYVEHRDLRRALEAGAAHAATVIRHLGAVPDLTPP